MNAISPKLLSLNHDHAKKNLFFWSNSDKTETKEIEMLELTKLWSHDHIYKIIWVQNKIYWWNHEQVLRCHKLFSKYSYLRKPEANNFADIIKVSITLFKTAIKSSIKDKRVANYLLKCIF